MNVNNLVFFDKNGESYNFSLNSLGYWEGSDYFLPISIALFDCSNIFVLENSGTNSYQFPKMEEGSKFEIKWVSREAKDNFFLFTVLREGVHSDSFTYIQKAETITINHSDFGQSGTLNLSYPLQINVAFTPSQEISYTRVLQVYYTVGDDSTLVLEMTFYGEGEDEDERYRIWLENLGVKFNREDALLLKDYDLKEGLPDWNQINLARKSILVSIDQVYPYVGTYKGLTNLLNLLGYKDVLRVKEYWQDSDPNSRYYKNFAMVDVTDLMNIGEFSELNLVDLNGQIKKGGKFKKTEFLALTYAFTVASDTYDEDGLPEVVPTTDFSTDEIFFKLKRLEKKLKVEILPINVIIKDIIGEFIYFNKLNLRDWPDTTYVESSTINDDYTILVLSPDTSAVKLKIRDVRSLYPKLDGVSPFPEISFNSGTIEPYQNRQHYDTAELSYLIEAISDYYENLVHYDFYHPNETNPIDFGDDTLPKIGCPIVLEAYVPDLTLGQLSGITFGDFVLSDATTSSTLNTISLGTKYFSCATIQSFNIGSRVKITVSIDQSSYMIGTVTELSPIGFSLNTIKVSVDTASGFSTSTGWVINLVDTHFTIGNIKYKNSYEIEWTITGPKNYYFQWRDTVSNLYKIPHVLPYTGEYSIDLKVHDMHGGVSTAHKQVIVESESPVLEAFVKIQDKTKYDFANLHNVTIGDLGSCPLYWPYATILNFNGENEAISNLTQHYLDWCTYSLHYGVGSPQEDASVSNLDNRWGTGSANGQPILSDYNDAQFSDLKFVTFADMEYVADTIDGFFIEFKNLVSTSPSSYLSSMQFGGFDQVEFFILIESAEDFINYIELMDLPGWNKYRYQILGNRIKATAKFQDKQNHSILKFAYTLSGVYNGEPYLPNSIDLDISTKQIQVGTYVLLQSEMLGPSGPFWLGPSGPWWYGPSGPFWENSVGEAYYVGPSGIISYGLFSNSEVPDEGWPDPSSSLWPSPSNWLFPTIYSNTTVKLGDRLRIRNSEGGYAEGFVTGISDYNVILEVDLINEVGDFTEFDLATVDTVYTFSKPITVFSPSDSTSVQETLLGAGYRLDEDLLFLVCPFDDQLISLTNHTAAPASDIRYWISGGYVYYDNVLGTQTGFLPSCVDQNSLNLQQVRSTKDTVIVPKFHPVFITICNLASNVYTEWVLKKWDGSVVCTVNTTSYFIWRFDEDGLYKLTVTSTDSRGNSYVLSTDIAVSQVMTCTDYENYVEQWLNDRKFKMTHSG